MSTASRGRRRFAYASGAVAVVVLVVACGAGPGERDVAIGRRGGGLPAEGRRLIVEYGCGSCHRIEGVPNARSLVGPPLDHWARRSYIAGTLPNTEDNMVDWLLDPASIRPGTAMPDVGLTPGEARHVAAYLLSLR